jgi:flagellar basal-body rod protein FlgC
MLNFISGISSTSAALNAERIRMEVVSQNIANANTTRGLDGKPYRRQQVVFEAVLSQQQMAGRSELPLSEVRVARIQSDQRPLRQVYNPDHPDHDAQGYVSLPNVEVHEEMADLITSSRAFEANLAVVKNARSMALQTLSIGKR